MKKILLIFSFIAGVGLIIAIFLLGYSTQQQKQSATISSSASETVAPYKKQRVFMIALGNDGEMGEKIGCGDSLIGIDRWVLSEGDIVANTYVDLLALHDAKYDDSGLYNALWQSSLKLKSASVAEGVVTLALEGELKITDACDKSRIQAQLEKPALQTPGVQAIRVTVNGQPLSQILAQQ